MDKNRNCFVDQLKGFACLCVAFGHVIMGIRKAGVDTSVAMVYFEEYIWTFHVPLFIFLSGYVYRLTGGWESKGNRFNFILHKFLNLGIPYFFFSTLYILINIITPGVNNRNSLSDILLLWKMPTAQHWFLYALFFLFVIWIIIPVRRTVATIILTLVCTILSMTSINLGFLGVSLGFLG